MRSSSSISPALKILTLFSCACLLAACSSKKTAEDQQYGVVVVNAPAAGAVRRILVSEGTAVSAGTPIVEIAVQDNSQTSAPAAPGESAESKAVRGVRSSQSEIDAARAEVIKHQAEVERLTPLVASGQASQPQLDGERALYEKAQQRLQKAQAAEQQAEVELRVSREPGAQNGTLPSSTPREQIVVARATSAGTVAVISAHVGDHVTAGQPLGTLRATAP